MPPLMVPPAGGVSTETVQVKVVPGTEDVILYPTAVLSHIVLLPSLLMNGIGLIVMATTFELLEQAMLFNVEVATLRYHVLTVRAPGL